VDHGPVHRADRDGTPRSPHKYSSERSAGGATAGPLAGAVLEQFDVLYIDAPRVSDCSAVQTASGPRFSIESSLKGSD